VLGPGQVSQIAARSCDVLFLVLLANVLVRCNGNAIHIEIESHAKYEERNTYVMKSDFVLI
jgi:hypothetical protein